MDRRDDLVDKTVKGAVKTSSTIGGGTVGAGTGTAIGYVVAGSAMAAGGWAIGAATGMAAGYSIAKKFLR